MATKTQHTKTQLAKEERNSQHLNHVQIAQFVCPPSKAKTQLQAHQTRVQASTTCHKRTDLLCSEQHTHTTAETPSTFGPRTVHPEENLCWPSRTSHTPRHFQRDNICVIPSKIWGSSMSPGTARPQQQKSLHVHTLQPKKSKSRRHTKKSPQRRSPHLGTSTHSNKRLLSSVPYTCVVCKSPSLQTHMQRAPDSHKHTLQGRLTTQNKEIAKQRSPDHSTNIRSSQSSTSASTCEPCFTIT